MIAKKEIVNNKEYEKQLLKKSLAEIQDELVILKKLLDQKEKNIKQLIIFLIQKKINRKLLIKT